LGYSFQVVKLIQNDVICNGAAVRGVRLDGTGCRLAGPKGEQLGRLGTSTAATPVPTEAISTVQATTGEPEVTTTIGAEVIREAARRTAVTMNGEAIAPMAPHQGISTVVDTGEQATTEKAGILLTIELEQEEGTTTVVPAFTTNIFLQGATEKTRKKIVAAK